MKRNISILLALLLLCCLLAFSLGACSAFEVYSEGEGELNVLCTTFAPFDFARVVGGDRVTVSLLQDSGADLHNYTPTAATLKAISDADVFIFIGGTSDHAWIDKTVDAAGNKSLSTLCLLDHITPIFAEMENDWTDHHGEGHGDDHDHDHSHDHEGHDHTSDEHIWTSVRNAEIMVQEIRDIFIEKDPEGRDTYEKNAAAYIASLRTLDKEFEALADALADKPLLFADRFPFVYLLHDYHISYIAAFSGCSSEVNAGFDTQIHLINTVKEKGIDFIVTIEGGDKHLAEAIKAETSCRIITLDSLQSVSRKDVEAGKTYLDTMKKNAKALREVLYGTD